MPDSDSDQRNDSKNSKLTPSPSVGSLHSTERERWLHNLPKKQKPLLPSCYTDPASHCELVYDEVLQAERISEYRNSWLTSFRVFFAFTGTIFQHPLLWSECGLVGVIYWLTYWSVLYFRMDGFGAIIGSDANIRGFMEMFSLFIGLLLTFYTSLRIARWWSQRTQGFEAISQACDKLTLLLSQGVTRNDEVLDAIRRYGDASLLLYFLEDFSKEEKLDMLEYFEFLTKDEKEKLASIRDPNLWAQAIWVWPQHLIDKCNEAGLTAGPPHYVQLKMACEGGRRGAAHVSMFDMAPMPMAYVHLLGMMVKLHNLLLAFLMALLGVKHAGRDDWIAFGRTCFRAFFMPFLYNSIMIMGDLLANPFGHDVTSFAHVLLRQRLRKDCNAITKVGDELPEWIAKLKEKKVRTDSPTAIP